ncbi:MAG: hypothetical protein ACXVX6_05315 [Mycobacterium sp.]
MTEPKTAEKLAKSMAADLSWANTVDRPARTRNARRAADERFMRLANGDAQRAESLRKAHFKRMALRSIAVRKAKAAARNGGAA